MWRLRAEAQDTAEAALRDAALRDAAPATSALVSVSEQFPGTPASGLARLLAGLRLVEAGQPAGALTHLTHPDVQRTLLLVTSPRPLGLIAMPWGRMPGSST